MFTLKQLVFSGKSLLVLSFVLVLSCGIPANSLALEAPVETPTELVQDSEGEHAAQDEHPTADHGEAAAHEDHGGHENNTDPLFFIIIALLIGAAIRHFLKKSPLPFTVMLLLIGLGAGVISRLGYFDIWSIGALHIDVSSISRSINWAANIDPHMLLYVFLPILIFEAAFAMDVHTFKKSASNAILLAVPGIVIALVLTAAFVMGLQYMGVGFDNWGWPMALMFGAVISATDPVAVVALLKDLGASKKLGTLIEGESLLNDGTAIVIFMVFFLGMTGAASDNSPFFEFFRVALGGTAIGLIIGFIVLAWLKRVINDAMVEISVVIAGAYLTFYIAEHTFHVSGVLALVALGLVMSGVGKSRISPKVEHFMHEFWELAGFIANSLIFLIVGVVIAERSVFSVNDFVLLGLIYVAIHVVRIIVITVLYPFMRKSGYGLQLKEAYVLWYGALRGAIGLALALIVAGVDDQYIPAEIKNQFLFITAGIVTLTLLINATTIKFLVNGLGLTKVPAAKALMIRNAYEHLRTASENQMERIKSDRYMKNADFNEVTDYLPKIPASRASTEKDLETIAEIRRRILEKEKSSYWHQFQDGLLGPTAVRKLSDGISEVLDAGGMVSLAERKDLEEAWDTPALLEKLSKLPLVGGHCERMLLNRLTISYDCAVGFIEAQAEALKLVESIQRGGNPEEVKHLELIESEINENRIHGQTFVRNLRKNNPDVYKAISTRQAIRSSLSYERKTVERMEKKGWIQGAEAYKMYSSVDQRAKHLRDFPPEIKHAKVAKKKSEQP